MRRFKGAWLRTVSQKLAGRYAIAVAAFLLTFIARDSVDNWLIGISDRGLVIFLPAILLVTFFLGLGPAIVTALISFFCAWYFFIPPYQDLGSTARLHLARLPSALLWALLLSFGYASQ